MAKSKTKKRKLSTNEALEQLLGHKAAKRLRKLAMQFADEQRPKKKSKKAARKKKPQGTEPR